MKKSKVSGKSKGKKAVNLIDLQQNVSISKGVTLSGKKKMTTNGELGYQRAELEESPVIENRVYETRLEEPQVKMPGKKMAKTKYPVRQIPAASTSGTLMPVNILQQFEAANASVVNMQDTLEELNTEKKAIPKTKAQSNSLKQFFSRPVDKVTRDVLFDELKSPEVYPVHKLLDIILKRDKSKDLILYFTGIEQLTDSVFGRLLEEIEMSKEVADLRITGVDLSGCKQLTDQAVFWMAKCFPKITKVKLSGCWNLTGRSLAYLYEHCQQLRDVEAIATGISLVPQTLPSVTLTLDGSPLLSPRLSDLEALKAGKDIGLKPLQTVRACIFPVDKAPSNFLSYMSSGTVSTQNNAQFFGHSEIKLADGSVCQVTECPQVACCWPEFLSERTIYILPYDAGQGDASQIATSIVKVISVISAQVSQPFFIPVGTLSANTLTSAIRQILKSCEDNLKKELDVFNDKKKVEEMTYQTQCLLGKARQLLHCLQTASSRLNPLEINTANTKDKDNLLSLLMRLRDEDMKKAYPEYSDISGDLMTAVMSLPKLLPKDMATQEAAIKSIKAGKLPKFIAASDCHIEKALNLAHSLGLILQVPSVTSNSFVAKPDWLMGFLNSLFSKQGVNPDVENGLPAGIPCLPVNSVQDAFGMDAAKELGVALVRGADVGLLLSLPDQPTVSKGPAVIDFVLADVECSMSYLWEPQKRSCDLEVAYKYTFPCPVSDGILCRIQKPILEFYSSSVKAIWKTGVILQDAVVDILIEKEEQAGTSCLRLEGRIVNPGEGLQGTYSRAVEVLWNSVEQWKLMVDGAVLHEGLQLYAQCDIKADTKKPDKLFPVVRNHAMKLTNGKERCENCYIPVEAAGFLWKLASTLYPTFVEKEKVKLSAEDALEIEGVVWKGSQGKSGSASMRFGLNRQGATSLRVLMLKGNNADLAALKLHLSCDAKVLDGQFKITYDAGKVFIKGGEVKVLKPTTLKTGDIVSFSQSATATDPKKAHLTLCVNSEPIYVAELLSGNAVWTFTWEQTSTTGPVALMVDVPRGMGSHGYSGIMPGMRLEARDRQHPLICVATIEKINEDGKILIHFDGWTSRYDYWADPTSPDLHPLGYQDFIGYTHTQYSPELQKPKGYPKAFDWATYLKEINCLPVPHEFFTEEQTEGTPPTEELRALDASDLIDESSAFSNCTLLPNRPLCLEQRVFTMMADDTTLQRLWAECNSMTKFPCLLPAEFDKQKLTLPARRFVSDIKKQNVHFLCTGQGMESLHFVDSSGYQLDMELSDLKSLASVIRFIILVLTKQESFLPDNAVKLCPGIDSLVNGQAEGKLLKVLYQYLLQLELLSPWKPKGTTPDVDVSVTNKLAEKLFKSGLSDANHSLALDFPGAAESENHFMKCSAHMMALSENQQLTDTGLGRFQGYSKLVSKLQFQRNKIPSIPTTLGDDFSFLTHLNMADNLIQECPENLFKLTCLEWLDLSLNKISTLPASLEKVAKTLVHLNVSNNPLRRIPDVVMKLVNLEELRADNVGELTSLQGIDKMARLRVLSVSGNLLTQPLHEDVGKLPRLAELYMAGLPWFTGYDTPKSVLSFEGCSEFLNKSVVMSMLDKQKLFSQVDKEGKGSLTSVEVTELNKILFEKYSRFGDLTRAPTKSMKSCEGGFPSVLLTLTNLHTLDLSFHHLLSIPKELGTSLTKLSYLRLTDNPVLETLAAEVGSLPLKELHLKGCGQLKTPPKEIVNRGFGAVFGYLKRLAMGSVSCRRTKLMVVGLGGAGKTSLIQALTHRRFIDGMDFDDIYEMMGEAITDGIDITTWKVKVEAEKGGAQKDKRVQEGDSLEYSVWDFAGQTVYYNTHQFFLSTRAVYLLLWNVRLGYEHAGLDFWLSSIACHAPGAPVLVVGTHCDKVEKPNMPTDELKKRYPQIRGFHSVSSYTLLGIPDLQNQLIDMTLQEKYMGEQIPEAWLTMEKHIKQNTESKDLLPLSVVETIGNNCGVFDRVELIQAIEFLHDLGSVQFFNTDFLRSYVVINPQWIVDVMTCVVSVHEGAIKDGKFFHKDMVKVWADYPANMHTWLLRLTEEFDLTFPLHQEKANLVPCLLPDKEPKYNWPDVDRAKGHKETKMVYRFQYLPAGLFNRVQVRLHQFSDEAIIWKKGSLLKKNNHSALILQIGVNEMLIKVQGMRPENILFLVHEVLECLISESFYGVQYDFAVPCSDCLEVQSLDPCMFQASKVQRAVELKAPFLQCDRYFHTLSIPELQAAMPADKTADLDIHLGKSVRELQDLHGDLVLNVYFSYCKDNVPAFVGDDKMVHPDSISAGLRRAGMKVTASEASGGEDLTKLTLTLKEADVVLVGMSDEFVADKACSDLLYFARETLRKTVILVILGTGFKWQTSKLGILCASDVYVNMQQTKQFASKMGELIAAVKQRSIKNKVTDYPGCFVSYCWSNSKRAVDSGSRAKDGSLGWADPREVKDFLQKNGISCWLDVEQVGKGGLYEDIAEGLKEAKVMVAFVSDEYAESKNCQMEFRYAVTTLKIPTIVAVVGTGYQWERSEVGMLCVGYEFPKVNFQYENLAAHMDLLHHVQKLLPKQESAKEEKQPVKDEKLVAFQEVLELTQRKFLRHVTSYAESMDSTPYPRLIVLDIAPEATKPSHTEDMSPGGQTLEEFEKIAECYEEELSKPGDESAEVKPAQHSKYCFTLLCECDEGWHDTSPSIPIPAMNAQEEDAFTSDAAGYMARLFAILKHTSLTLGSLTTQEGERLRTYLDSICVKKGPEFQEEYIKIRRMVMELDKDGIMGNLKKCQLSNGKSAWLCQKHQPANRLNTPPTDNPVIPADKGNQPAQNTEETKPSPSAEHEDLDDKADENELVEKRPPLRALNKGDNHDNSTAGTPKVTSRACSVM